MRLKPRTVDLFCGCGGFSLGAEQARLGAAVAVDIDPILTSSFGHNFPKTKLLLNDVAQLNGDKLISAAGGPIDGVFGGPPCQAFSDIGRRAADDPRRELVHHFFRLVKETLPAFFVMENVRGLQYADNLSVLEMALSQVPKHYRIIGPFNLDAADFGAATKRRRLFVVGYDPGRCAPMTKETFAAPKCPSSTVRDAIADLSDAVELKDEDGFDSWKIVRPGKPSNYAKSLRSPDKTFSSHRFTVHSSDVVRRFRKLAPGDIDPVGRHPRLTWDGQCPTLRAGTGNDRGSYQSVRPIHPDQHRVITAREAARLQGFPDSFRFHQTVWHSFRMIGNSVAPCVSKAVLKAIKRHFDIGVQLEAAE